MIGIVVVSHSAALAQAAVDLAWAMVPGERPNLAIAAGADGGFGTDATAVAAAISEVASAEGVLVLMDLGSAVLSAEMAVEFVPEATVRLSPAPLVEGLTAAVVVAAGGGTLAEVAAEAEGALVAKRSALGETEQAGQREPGREPEETEVTASLKLINPQGLHARPAGQLAAEVGKLDAVVTIVHGDREADATSPILLLTLGAGQGAEIEVRAGGPQAGEAVELIRGLVEAGFGEM